MFIWITNTLIFFFVVIMAMIFGMTIINVVDKRLSEVTIKIPKQNVVVTLPDQNKLNNYNVGEEGFSSDHTLHSKPTLEQKNLKQNQEELQVPQTPFTNGESICIKKHVHGAGVGGICQYGPTNYAYPPDMSPTDRKVFKTTYPQNMTLQDYINWLWLYETTPDSLTKDHRKNFEALKRGMVLSYSDMPSSKKSPPLNSQEYFDKLYDLSGQVNWRLPLNMDTNGLLGYNFNDYSEFGQNFDQMGISSLLSNPYYLPIQQSARLVDSVVRNPQITNSAIRDRQGKHLRSKLNYSL